MRKRMNMKMRILQWVIILVVLIVLCIWGMMKTPWTQYISGYEDLTGLGKGVEEKNRYGGCTFNIERNIEYQIEMNGVISAGSITIAFYLNDTLLKEQTFQTGEFECEPVEISDAEGEVKIHVVVEEGTEGVDYDRISTRCRNWYKMYKRIYENFFAKQEAFE